MSTRPRLRPDPLRHTRHLTERDELLLRWLAEHQMLTTSQIATALFPSLRAAQKRLTLLHRIGAVDRIALATRGAYHGEMRYTLGPLGVLIHPSPSRRSHLARRAQIGFSPRRDHLLGVNGFFTDLWGHARRHPGSRLARWWSEQRLIGEYPLAQIRPDGHGVWQAHGRTVGFYLEHDRGTEALTILKTKIANYEKLTHGGATYPVLFHLPTPAREANLREYLAEARYAVPIATGVHGHDPASSIWALLHGDHTRLALHQLPSHPGQPGITNPVYFAP